MHLLYDERVQKSVCVLEIYPQSRTSYAFSWFTQRTFAVRLYYDAKMNKDAIRRIMQPKNSSL